MKLNVWETLRISYNHGSKRNGLLTSILHGFGFVLGGSVLVFAVISFMFPSNFATLVTNPIILKTNNLERFSSPHSQKSSSNVTTSSVVPIDLPGKLVVTEDNLVPTLSTNFSSDSNSSSTKAYDQKQRNEGNVDSSGAGDCNIFEGDWVMANDSKLYYPPGSCPYLKSQRSFDCHSNGRLDDEYLKWQWQWQSHPTNAGCIENIPSFLNATDFLERLRGKKLVFAGDSLNRNMYTSMVYIFWSVIPDKSRIERSGGDFTTVYKDYNCTVAFVHTAFLVNHLGVHTPEKETLRLDLIDEASSSRYHDADIIVFDSWHWWGDDKTHYGYVTLTHQGFTSNCLNLLPAMNICLT
ncbi:protein trichome birefringence-like 2 [Papaver somniferum]|uniref:protein trichome birefringence-like 2 n=1 Tax=Papaver somniferum TaxID=3469 RepID=UPI000E6FDD37|nr:protein trichome birefringence-like 2 [Papaver somniferum]